MRTDNTKSTDEMLIGEMIESWITALRARDVDALMSHYAPDVLFYDLSPPLAQNGTEAYRRSWQQWLPTFIGPIGFEMRNLRITTGDDVAFSTSLNRLSGTRTSGEKADFWLRATVCYRKVSGKWLVAHEHVSVPFYRDGTLKAAVNLKP
jgi:uncharacterized protein (TIGR02246 family)